MSLALNKREGARNRRNFKILLAKFLKLQVGAGSVAPARRAGLARPRS
nr:MAG TPA: hypothetical protein [Caudoviricetes sp.]